MKIQTLILFLALSQIVFGQVGNEKEVVAKNSVKSAIEKHCFVNSGGSCTVIYQEYDKNGNSVEWNMGRLNTIYREVYDKNDNNIMTLRVDKSDTTQIDTIQCIYDDHNELTRRITITDTTEFENSYDETGRLSKIASQSTNVEGNIVKQITTKTWTPFDKIRSETTITEIVEIAKKTEYGKDRESKIDFQYDQNQNLTKTTYYRADTISKTIFCKYDSKNRLIEKIEDDPRRAKGVNTIGFGNREDIKLFKTAIQYNQKGQIDELYTYFVDPCMSLDNHFLYKHNYHSSGLLDYVDVYEKNELIFTIAFEYKYYK